MKLIKKNWKNVEKHVLKSIVRRIESNEKIQINKE